MAPVTEAKQSPTPRSRKARVLCQLAKKQAFSQLVKSCELHPDDSQQLTCTSLMKWNCCGETFDNTADICQHVSRYHGDKVEEEAAKVISSQISDVKKAKKPRTPDVLSIESTDSKKENSTKVNKTQEPGEVAWMPDVSNMDLGDPNDERNGLVTLFYKYCQVERPEELEVWQRDLCTRLKLTGKVRVSAEGINATVGGSSQAVYSYIQAVRAHPLFCHMTSQEFKLSPGSATSFPGGLKVGVYQELVPMGVDSSCVSFREAGVHLSVDDFHGMLEQHLQRDDRDSTVFVDCRNFYESRIGHFLGAVAPDIRKFSYWPEYVDKNTQFFQDKTVVMFCTGGIRCEKGSAYLKSKGVCKDVLQLEGGIHKYMEKYPNGYFRGKLFVFDDRYAIPANSDIVGECFYCKEAWDKYQPCSSAHCHQLVLSCDRCTAAGYTACCRECQLQAARDSAQGVRCREECACTKGRRRIPVEV
ncbi:thiosulfate sulfurtransferase/rhodanese-like domain-containing protein 2 [Branchiostoma floridae]|uniref:Thiosulfate sulfurtransferase/rhodanese-like domain-containing protein 2 n=1 Tax=Branchiostoma floridae TaxID=7739 RepID=A0A9J7N811_BRAFL|nr:thiosulfate sulfurtransferase/rhodanese-like domain-containing protein 2 [Branchiostoma floridae]